MRTPRPVQLAALVAASALVVSACGATEEPEPSAGSTPTPTATEEPTPAESPTAGALSEQPEVLGEVATGLQAPWGADFLPDGTALVTERDTGRIFRLGDDDVQAVAQIEESVPSSEGGLLGVAVSPDFEQDQRVFLYYSTDSDNRVARTTFDGTRLGDLEPILTDIPMNTFHNGGRLAFGPDDQLYVATGDAGEPALSQDRGSLAGKVLRITQDGEPSEGNPDGTAMYALGLRNVQGLAWDDRDRLWATEFGAQTWDELNLIEPGSNYGWPEVEGEGGPDAPAEFVDPQVQWSTDDASPSGLAFAGGRLYMAALAGQQLWRIDVDEAGAGDDAAYFSEEYGRIRLVATAPDGDLWVGTSNRDGRGDPADDDDRVLLVSP